jgi:hypothetical protein
MTSFKPGDRVKITDREITAADTKSSLYYDYFRNLTGTVQHIYEDNTICVIVDQDSLPDSVRIRHLEIEEAARNRWLHNLSQEQRDKLSEADKSLHLSYNILVGADDLLPGGKAKSATRAKADIQKAGKSASASKKDETTERRTPEEIDKDEEEYLKSITAQQEGK